MKDISKVVRTNLFIIFGDQSWYRNVIHIVNINYQFPVIQTLNENICEQ